MSIESQRHDFVRIQEARAAPVVAVLAFWESAVLAFWESLAFILLLIRSPWSWRSGLRWARLIWPRNRGRYGCWL
jgi:hypothetical protein